MNPVEVVPSAIVPVVMVPVVAVPVTVPVSESSVDDAKYEFWVEGDNNVIELGELVAIFTVDGSNVDVLPDTDVRTGDVLPGTGAKFEVVVDVLNVEASVSAVITFCAVVWVSVSALLLLSMIGTTELYTLR